jgi:hypothetical protein
MKSSHERWTLRAMWVTLGLIIASTAVPYVDRATGELMAEHVSRGYPDYTQTRVDSAVTTYLVLATVVGVIAVVAWSWTMRAVSRGRRWARPAATVVVVLGASAGLAGLLTRDTSGATGLPAALGWAGMVPWLAALVAVGLLWMNPGRTTVSAGSRATLSGR